jgi:hypothetical protein
MMQIYFFLIAGAIVSVNTSGVFDQTTSSSLALGWLLIFVSLPVALLVVYYGVRDTQKLRKEIQEHKVISEGEIDERRHFQSSHLEGHRQFTSTQHNPSMLYADRKKFEEFSFSETA